MTSCLSVVVINNIIWCIHEYFYVNISMFAYIFQNMNIKWCLLNAENKKSENRFGKLLNKRHSLPIHCNIHMSLGIQNRIEASITYSLLKSKFPLKSSSQKKKKIVSFNLILFPACFPVCVLSMIFYQKIFFASANVRS